MPALLEVQPVGAAGRLGQQNVQLSRVPCGYVVLIVQHGESEAPVACFQRSDELLLVEAETVKHEGFLAVQRVDQFIKGIQLAPVDLVHRAVLVVQAAVAQLEQLAGQGGRLLGGDGLAVHIQQVVLLQLLVGRLGRLVQHHRDVVDDLLRQSQVVGGFEAEDDVPDGGMDGLRSLCFRLVAVLGGPEVLLPIVGDVPAQPLPLIQQPDLRPEVQQAVGAGRPGQLHQLVDAGAHGFEGFEALGCMVLEAGRLIQHHHVKIPLPAQRLHQPRRVLRLMM